MEASRVLSLIGNREAVALDRTDYYAGIIGESPSKGARSPILWNAVFAEIGASCLMHPMDVEKNNLEKVIDAFREDRRFIGGAVAVPYKEALVPLLDDIEEEAQTIGAVNCVYKVAGRLKGANTDGAGAIKSLKSFMAPEPLSGKDMLVMGMGGAGKSVAAYAAKAAGRSGRVILANRTVRRAEVYAERLDAYTRSETAKWPVSDKILRDVDILINCTSVGYQAVRSDGPGVFTLHPYCPLGPIDDSIRVQPGADERRRYFEKAMTAVVHNIAGSLEAFQCLKKNPTVFDIIYQPSKTTLLHLAECHGLPIKNGLDMNLEQAVIAFRKAVEPTEMANMSAREIRRIMSQAG